MPETTSQKALYPIKKLLPKGYKIGHTGTLDPNATGLLVVALGRATKFIRHLEKSSKIYTAELKFGLTSDTLDIWGKLEDKVVRNQISKEQFLSALKNFEGEITQVPPMYSAIKKNGVPLYKLARQGVEIERKERQISIYSIDLLAYDFPNATIKVDCSKGTYIRTLIDDIATNLGENAVMTALNRTKSDYFLLSDACVVAELETLDDVAKRLISIEECFLKLDKIYVDSKHAVHLKNGVKVDLARFCKYQVSDKDYAVHYEDEFIGIANWQGDKILLSTRV